MTNYMERELEANHQKAQNLLDQGDLDQAIRLYEAVVGKAERLQNGEEMALQARDELGMALHLAGRYEEAKDIFEALVKLREAQVDWKSSPDVLETRHNLACTLSELGEYRKAIELHRSNLRYRSRTLPRGPRNSDTILTQYELADCLSKIDKFDEAVQLDRLTLQQREQNPGSEDEETCNSRKNLACNLFYLQKYEEARALFKKNVDIRKKKASQGEIDDDDDSDSEQWLEDCTAAQKGLESKDRKKASPSPHSTKVYAKPSESPKKAKSPPPSSKGDQERKRSPSESLVGKGSSADPVNNPAIIKPIPFRPPKPTPKIVEPTASKEKPSGSERPKGNVDSSDAKPKEVRKSRSDDDLKKTPSRKSSSRPRSLTRLGRSNAASTRSKSPQSSNNAYPRLFDARNGSDDHPDALSADARFIDLENLTQKLLDEGRRDEKGRPTRGKTVKIAILDSGIDMSHPDMKKTYKSRIRERKSWVEGGRDNEDECGHGTHIAAIVLKIAPSAHVFIARVVRNFQDKDFKPSNVLGAIKWARDQWKVDIITMSIGVEQDDDITTTINKAAVADNNILFFAAASNDGSTKTVPIAFPAKLPTVFSIGSAKGSGTVSDYNPFDRRGQINYNALGEQVKAAWPEHLNQGKERRQSGSSIATPFAAAIAALILEFAYSERPFQSVSAEGLERIRRRLKTLDGMTTILNYLVYDKWILPWKLFNIKKSKGTLISARDTVMLDLANLLLN